MPQNLATWHIADGKIFQIESPFRSRLLPTKHRLVRGQLTLVYIAVEFTVEVDDGDIGVLNFYFGGSPLTGVVQLKESLNSGNNAGSSFRPLNIIRQSCTVLSR